MARGTSYETAIDHLVERFAAAWGDQYKPIGTTIGRVSGAKKGDGLLHILGQPCVVEPARVVLEMTLEESGRRDWVGYLEECERNREAQASLGVVPRIAQVPGGERIRIFGPNRMVLAFDPDRDDECILRTVLHLLRYQAITAASRKGTGRTYAAQEKLAEARELLERLNPLYSTTTLARARMDKVASELDSLRSRLQRLLNGAGHDLEECGGASEGSP